MHTEYEPSPACGDRVFPDAAAVDRFPGMSQGSKTTTPCTVARGDWVRRPAGDSSEHTSENRPVPEGALAPWRELT